MTENVESISTRELIRVSHELSLFVCLTITCAGSDGGSSSVISHLGYLDAFAGER